MLGVKVWRRLLGVDDRTVIERVEFDEGADAVVAHVRPRRLRRHRCGRCGRRAPGYDQGEGPRRWQALDLGEIRSFLEADAPPVNCPEHGPTVIQVPWARHGAGHTRAVDDTVAWLAVHTSKTQSLSCCASPGSRAEPSWPAWSMKPERRSIPSIRYLTVVVDHDSGRLVWAAKGHDKDTLEGFFDALVDQRCA